MFSDESTWNLVRAWFWTSLASGQPEAEVVTYNFLHHQIIASEGKIIPFQLAELPRQPLGVSLLVG